MYLGVRRGFLKILTLLIAIWLLLIPSADAFADVAPPAQPPGSNPQPGEEITQVRMVEETVTMEILADYALESLGQARVQADFVMRNLGDETETMAARFPIGASDGFFDVLEIKNLQIRVNGQNVAHRRITGEDPHFSNEETPWAEFDVTFPPGEDVSIRVMYTLDGTGYYPFISYEYILSTGAGWKGSIGSAEIILKFPYQANTLNTRFEEHEFSSPHRFDGNEAHWTFEDFEPTRADNLEFYIIAPAAWNKILVEDERVKDNPNDGEAWGRLGKAYKEILFYGKGMRGGQVGAEIFGESDSAYSRCLELLPEDSLWHAGYAELLLNYYIWNASLQDANHPSLIKAMDEVHRALELDPNNELALELAQRLVWEAPDGAVVEKDDGTYDFFYLTATPALPSGPEPAPVIPTETSAPTWTPESASGQGGAVPASDEDDSDTGLPICGGAALILPVVTLYLGRRRLKNRIS
jgi:tetratricopeptide (TPR) repeat protein